MSRRALHFAQILWPAFMIAGVLEMVVFAWVDPHVISFGGAEVGPQAVYTGAFFVFWALVAVAAEVSHWMIKAADAAQEVATRPVRRQGRRHAKSPA